MITVVVPLLLLSSLVDCNFLRLDIADDILPITTTFYEEKDGHRMVESIKQNTFFDANELVDCYMYGDRYIIDEVLKLIPSNLVEQVDKKEMSKLVNECSKKQYQQLNKGVFHSIKTPFDFVRKAFKSTLIFPGTKWCGAGDVADDYEDLGLAEATDKCCRTHDHCNDTISGFDKKYGLRNYAFYTKSHCVCDDVFHSCLSNGKSVQSDLVGYSFFNVLQIQCFKNDYPIIKCKKEWGIPYLRSICQEYEQDETKPQQFQFFDAKFYESQRESSFLQDLLSR